MSTNSQHDGLTFIIQGRTCRTLVTIKYQFWSIVSIPISYQGVPRGRGPQRPPHVLPRERQRRRAVLRLRRGGGEAAVPEAGEEGEAKSEGGKFERGGGGRGRDGPGANNPGRQSSYNKNGQKSVP